VALRSVVARINEFRCSRLGDRS
jgi:Protein of unknown function (DUF1559).